MISAAIRKSGPWGGVLLALCLSGCAYKVRLESDPVGARVVLPKGEVISTPEIVRLRYVPFGHQRVTVTSSGYRTLELDLRRSEVTLWHVVRSRFRVFRNLGPDKSAQRVEFVLIPEHGPAGTWTPEDQGLAKD